jgi:hypothetical protein
MGLVICLVNQELICVTMRKRGENIEDLPLQTVPVCRGERMY